MRLVAAAYQEDRETALLDAMACTQAIERLPARQSLVIRWTYWWGYTYPEQGRKLGISGARVQQIKVLAEARLRKILMDREA